MLLLCIMLDNKEKDVGFKGVLAILLCMIIGILLKEILLIQAAWFHVSDLMFLVPEMPAN